MKYSSVNCPFCGHDVVDVSCNLNWYNVECMGEFNGIKCRGNISGTHEYQTGYGKDHLPYKEAKLRGLPGDSQPRWDGDLAKAEGLKKWNTRV